MGQTLIIIRDKKKRPMNFVTIFSKSKKEFLLLVESKNDERLLRDIKSWQRITFNIFDKVFKEKRT